MIVRISGPDAHQIAQSFVAADIGFPAGSVTRRKLFCDGLVTPSWVYAARAPRSATGEDTIEFHLPGNPILAQIVLKSIIAAGARLAEPGEFTARAYFNRRLDLAAAEGVAAVIAANSEQEFAAARQLMAGELTRQLRPILDALSETLALLETGIDFAEEEITVLDRRDLLQRVTNIGDELRQLQCNSGRLAASSRVPTIVFAGHPNAGKSSLLNALAGRQRAVISPAAGTTRDALSVEIRLKRGFVRIVDLPGIESADFGDDIAAAMQATATRAIAAAEVAVLVRDITDQRPAPELPVAPHLTVFTKSDLHPPAQMQLAVSAATGEGLARFRERLDEIAFERGGEMLLMLNERHVRAIEAAREILGQLLTADDRGVEIDAALLRTALDSLGSILGEVTPDDIIGKIFSTFCIGK